VSVGMSVHHVTKIEAMANESLGSKVYSRHLKVYAKQWYGEEPREVLDIVLFSDDLDRQQLEIEDTKKLADLVSDLQNAKVDVEYPDEPELTQGFQKVTITFAGKEYTDVTNFIDAIQKRLSGGDGDE